MGTWHRLETTHLAIGDVEMQIVDGRALAVTRTDEAVGVLDNRCPHQGGPLGEGTIEDGCLKCPWHGYDYDPVTGRPPEGFDDVATSFPTEIRDGELWVELPERTRDPSLMDQMVRVMTDWGIDTVFGMVGHSNLGLADAFRLAEEEGRLSYIGIRHEGAASFAASGYAKLTGRPAACFSIAGPGTTNLLTGLWDAKVDRAPILALTGQVNTQVLGPGAFQEIPLAAAFEAVAEWSQTVLGRSNACELMGLAIKHAEVRRDVAHLIFPDEVQELPEREPPEQVPRRGRISTTSIAPPEDELERAIELLSAAERPVVVMGNGARAHRAEVVALADQIDAPVITTFKGKGLIGDDHRLGGGVVGRSGTPIASALMTKADALVAFGASFSHHSGIATWVPTIQVDFDRMHLGKFHPVDVPLWGEIGRTVELLRARLDGRDRPDLVDELARRRTAWREETERRAGLTDDEGRMHPAALYSTLAAIAADDAALAVDVGNNTYAFGRYFETRRDQDVVMSGYLGSIGFAFPAAMGLWAALRDTERRIVSISGDGGFGQYMAEFTTAVKHRMPIVHVLSNNTELGKITREQLGALRAPYQTSLVNPDFAAFAESCGGVGLRVDDPADLEPTLQSALDVGDRPVLVEVAVSSLDT